MVVSKKLIGLEMLDRNIARHGYDVYYNGEKTGHITSGCVSPSTGKNIALAYVKNDKEICTGAIVQVMIREKLTQNKFGFGCAAAQIRRLSRSEDDYADRRYLRRSDF